MKKENLRAAVAAIVTLVLYILVAFLIPFVHTTAFWVSFVFTVIAIVVVSASIYTAFLKNPDAKSRFYGFPIARIGVIYGIVQLIASLIVMALGQVIPWWIPTLLYAIGLGVAVIGLISVETVVEEIQTQDAKLKKDVSLMRALQSKVNQLAAQSEDADLKALAEEIRYSDPVSNEAVAEAETDLAAVIDELQAAYIDGDKEAVKELCRKTSVVLAERNRLCKLNKN